MDSDQTKGTITDAAGKLQLETGEAMGGTTQQVKGTLKQAEGKAQKALGDAKAATNGSWKRPWAAPVVLIRWSASPVPRDCTCSSFTPRSRLRARCPWGCQFGSLWPVRTLCSQRAWSPQNLCRPTSSRRNCLANRQQSANPERQRRRRLRAIAPCTNSGFAGPAPFGL